eukprot:GHVN01074599.1.p1 GENE.GHVN01074599.1~~GHVN01074599.1.p1  ORF type:complete len:327 (-),score=74.27 GHVN01074599.1:224-1204(-)
MTGFTSPRPIIVSRTYPLTESLKQVSPSLSSPRLGTHREATYRDQNSAKALVQTHRESKSFRLFSFNPPSKVPAEPTGRKRFSEGNSGEGNSLTGLTARTTAPSTGNRSVFLHNGTVTAVPPPSEGDPSAVEEDQFDVISSPRGERKSKQQVKAPIYSYYAGPDTPYGYGPSYQNQGKQPNSIQQPQFYPQLPSSPFGLPSAPPFINYNPYAFPQLPMYIPAYLPPNYAPLQTSPLPSPRRTPESPIDYNPPTPHSHHSPQYSFSGQQPAYYYPPTCPSSGVFADGSPPPPPPPPPDSLHPHFWIHPRRRHRWFDFLCCGVNICGC